LEHGYFEQLCTLALIGELSEDELHELEDHLHACATCRQARHEFSLILRELPSADPAMLSVKPVRITNAAGFRQRFIERAQAAGVCFSKDTLRRNHHITPYRIFPKFGFSFRGLAAASLVGTLVVLAGYRLAHRVPSIAPATTSVVVPPSLVYRDIEQSRGPDGQSNVESSNKVTPSEVRKQNSSLTKARLDFERQLKQSQDDKARLEQVIDQHEAQITELQEKVQDESQLRAAERTELDKVRADKISVETNFAVQQRGVEDLSQELRMQSATLEHTRELLSEGRDIRELMSARSLHIVDVYDTDGKGNNKRSFGRVFYTEGKSLIFYAFDLDDKQVVEAKYAYEAWGERVGQESSVRRLGVFYVDDISQKRWILRVDDKEHLSDIDSVFVTLEKPGSSHKPRGAKLLYAFLGSAANHP
jgi:hypothetical protein